MQAEGKAALDAAVSGLAEADRLRRATQVSHIFAERLELAQRHMNPLRMHEGLSRIESLKHIASHDGLSRIESPKHIASREGLSRIESLKHIAL